MRNAGARGVKIDAVLASERFDLRILFQILRRCILNVVIDGEDRLRRIGDCRRTNLLELRDHRAGVVMCHHVTRTNGNKIAGAYNRVRSESISVACDNLLDERQAHANYPRTVSF